MRALTTLAFWSLASTAVAASIEHKAIGCVVAGEFPRFEARLTPPEAVARARVLFRAEGGSAWYAVAMKPEGDVFAAFLPKAKKTLKRFNYYVEVSDAALATSRTAEHTTSVVADGGCAKDMMGMSTAVASVLLEVPAGAPLVPTGFSSAGIAAAGAGAPSTAGAAAATSGGGGVATGAVVAGVGAAAAGGGILVATQAGGNDTDDTSDGSGNKVSIVGVVFASFGPDASSSMGPGIYSTRVVGALVSTSLDSVTAVTDGQGQFRLNTNTLEKDARCYTITITAAGLPTYNIRGFTGSQSGSSPSNIPVPESTTHRVFSLSPPQPQGNSCS